MRQRRWRLYYDALREIEKAPRTWFVTFTYSEASLGDGGYKDVQVALNRLRMASMRKAKKRGVDDVPVRYLCSKEYGSKKGRLHFHLLIHCSPLVTKAMIRAAWNGKPLKSTGKVNRRRYTGNVHTALVRCEEQRPKAEASAIYRSKYVVKYLYKEDGRVKRSKGYGQVQERNPAAVSEGRNSSSPRSAGAFSDAIQDGSVDRSTQSLSDKRKRKEKILSGVSRVGESRVDSRRPGEG
jgi:hypothetical protein